MEILKNKQNAFFLISQGSLNPQIRFLGQKVWPVARAQTDGQTDGQVTTEGTLSGFQDFFLQPIIKDQPKIHIPIRHARISVFDDLIKLMKSHCFLFFCIQDFNNGEIVKSRPPRARQHLLQRRSTCWGCGALHPGSETWGAEWWGEKLAVQQQGSLLSQTGQISPG